MKIHNCEQKSLEWHKLRAGKLTASDFHTCLGDSQTKKTLLLKKTAERLISKCISDNYTNKDIERGIANENVARAGYELITGNKVDEVGFCELNDWVGCSPDGLVNDDGMIEIKCPKETVFLNQIIKDKIQPVYYTQIQFNLFVLNRKWCDYVAYNENFDLYIKRVERDEEHIEKIKNCIEDCKKEVLKNIEKYKKQLTST